MATKKQPDMPPPKWRGDKRGAKKGEFGNKGYKPSPEDRLKVEAYVAAGAQQYVIAKRMGISEDTLARHFREEIDHGRETALGEIGASMVTRAINGDHDAGKYVLATIGGWKTRSAVEQTGPNGGPIETINVEMNADEYEERARRIASEI